MALNVKPKKDDGIKCLNEYIRKMALNAKTKKDGDSKYMKGYEKQLWRPKLKRNGDGYRCGHETTNLNIELRMNNDSECQSTNVALNAKWEMNDDSKHQT